MACTGLVVLVAVLVCYLSYCDGTITGWSSPAITGFKGPGEVETPIPENTAANTETAVTIVAISDKSPTPTFVYEIVKPKPSPLFSIDGATGKITVVKKLDYETESQHVIEVSAKDGAETGAAITATATVTLNVGDVGPTFAEATAPVCVKEGSPADTAITTLTATKAGSGTISYTITNGISAPDDLFAIDSASGKVTVAKKKTLSSTKTYTLTVTATENSETATTELKIKVASECKSGSAIPVLSQALLIVAFVVSIY